MDLNKIAFVDIETTGCSPNYDRIIEIGILRVENNKLVEKYQTLVNPEVHLSSFITNLTGIKTEDLENAPLFENIKEDVQNILEGCVFIAHNVRFDYGFIKQELKRFGYLYSSKMLCTARLSRTLYPQHLHHSLDSLILRHKFTCKRRHRAFDDAKILWDFYQTLHHQFNAEILTKAINKVMKKPSIPIHLTEEDLDTLPESPGVYIFYGENKMPLYIGKSKNIRDRVNSHFLQDHASLREMNISKEVHRIETKTTSGELGALLMESALIKTMQPLYNRRLRIRKKMIIIKKKVNRHGYNEINQETVSQIQIKDLDNILGIFKSKKQIKEYLLEVAKEHKLCHKLLGLEKTKKSCFPYKLGECLGACLQKEKPLIYNLRFITAFTKKKLRKWPFSGPILIKEKNDENQEEYFLMDKWCLLGNISNIDSVEKPVLNNEYIFDYDIYKILSGYLRNPNSLKKINILNKSELKKLYSRSII